MNKSKEIVKQLTESFKTKQSLTLYDINNFMKHCAYAKEFIKARKAWECIRYLLLKCSKVDI